MARSCERRSQHLPNQKCGSQPRRSSAANTRSAARTRKPCAGFLTAEWRMNSWVWLRPFRWTVQKAGWLLSVQNTSGWRKSARSRNRQRRLHISYYRGYNMISTHPFGRTGHQSSRAILGAAAFGKTTQDETDRAMELALSYGVNHVDTAASYGESELRLGDWIRRNGQPFFLATKTGERTKDKAREEIHRSLVRLRVSRVDLLQLHCLVDPAEWETALGPDGALEAEIEG